MTTDVELLPLPEPAFTGMSIPYYTADQVRACVAHATAAKDAEIEALRAEAIRTEAELHQQAELAEARADQLQAELDNRWAQGMHGCHDKCQRIACVLRRQRDFELKRAERLAEAVFRKALGWRERTRLDKSDAQWMREKTYEQCADELDELLASLHSTAAQENDGAQDA